MESDIEHELQNLSSSFELIGLKPSESTAGITLRSSSQLQVQMSEVESPELREQSRKVASIRSDAAIKMMKKRQQRPLSGLVY